MKISILIILLVLSNLLFSNTLLFIPIQNHGTAIYLTINPAQNMSEIEKNQFQILYDNRYVLKDLSTKTIAFSKQYQQHLFGISYCDWGSEFYKEQNLNFSYRMKLNPQFNIGLGFNTVLHRQMEMKQRNVNYFPSLAVNYALSDKTELFFTCQSNLNFEPQNHKKLQLYFGGKHDLKKELKVVFLVSSNAHSILQVSGALCYHLNQENEIKLLLSSGLSPFGLAYSLSWKKIKCSFGLNYHLQLGMSNQIGLQYYH